ncbi:AraC family transcriptional regulator [Lederbergia sp. NSJ-179]|uniref:helix-turn-helix domain-containing protein n=1 Tax=Lederbergia sp. NSJ-179 TaxID=2931402 RepID=UPI001FCFB4B3|nr:helix-turn-helix domain-containing protein [Lederbergia sp. NSJ-179]MCJ7840717.1 AraC family transcriptional regulator [Lederbergia sp. NSJ-179]
MFKSANKKSKLLYRYLYSYLFVFMLPFATISIILYQISVGNLEKEINQSNLDKINQIRDIMDSRWIELNYLATRISYDRRLTPYTFTKPYSGKQAIEELIRYTSNSTLIDEILLNYHDSVEFVYSSKGASTLQTFMGSYPIRSDNIETFAAGLQAQTNPILQIIDTASKDGGDKKVLACTYPLPIYSSSPIGTVTFLIKETSFSDLIKNSQGEFDGTTFIFDDDFQLLARNKHEMDIDLDFVKDVLATETGIVNKKFANERYSFSIVRSETSNWTFATVIPTKQFYEKMTSLKQFIFVLLFLLTAVGLIVVCYLALKQYKPIKDLVYSFKDREQVEKNIGEKNEIELIRTKIESIYEDSELLKQKIIAHKPLVKAQFLSNLLQGKVRENQDIAALATDLKMSLQGESFFVIAISYKGKIRKRETLNDWDNIVKKIDQIVYNDCIGYGVESVFDYTAAVIVNSREDSSNSVLPRQLFVQHFMQLLEKQCEIMPFVGIGSIYSGADKINRSFIEATAAIENNFLNQQNTAICFEDLVIENQETIWFPEESRLKFVQSLKQGDQVVAKETLGEMLASIAQKNFSNYMLKCTCFDIINTILKTVAELGIDHHTEDMRNLSEFQSLDQLKKSVTTFIDHICLEVEKRKESHNYQLRDSIMEYIQKQYKHHNLSLEMISDHFQISSSYVSRFIREQTGVTFTQFVWELRMQECKHQLVNTSRTIKEIVLSIGYFDVSNFTRRFKKEEGITPSQYRKYYQQNNDETEAL